MYPPRILTIISRVLVHLGVNMWSQQPWLSGTQWWPCHRGCWQFYYDWGWLVGGVQYTPGCMVGNVSPAGSPSGTESSSMGLSTAFHLLGYFHGLIPLAWGAYSGCWVGAVGKWAVLWVFRPFCEHFHGWLVII